MSAETLLDVFVPPEGMVGHSAALVAMTGTEDFLEDAVQRFTGLRPRQRAELGNVLVYLMLDGHSSSSRQAGLPTGPHPRSSRVPAALGRIPVRSCTRRSRCSRSPRTGPGAPVHLRLAVLTANFTYTSARQQLELVWVVDVPLDGTARPEDRADVAAAGAFVETLLARRFHRDEQSAPAEGTQADSAARRPPRGGVVPRDEPKAALHPLARPLALRPDPRASPQRDRQAEELPSLRLRLLRGAVRQGTKPAVFGKLEDLGVFTPKPRRVALVEPSEAGAVAEWARAGETDGWEVVRPFDALDHNRRLHAKFVYAGYLRDGHVSNGWLYLGSGNLSRRGILTHGACPRGTWRPAWSSRSMNASPQNDIERWLFWAQDHAEAVDDDDWAVGQVGDAPDAQPILEAPPILSATIETTPTRRLRLLWREDVPPMRV